MHTLMRRSSIVALVACTLTSGACRTKPLETADEVREKSLLLRSYEDSTLTTPILDAWGGAADPFGQTKSARWVGCALRANLLEDGRIMYMVIFPYQSDIPLESSRAFDSDGTEYKVLPRFRADAIFNPKEGLRSGVWAVDVERSYLEARRSAGLEFDLENVPVSAVIPSQYVAGFLLGVDELLAN